MSIYRCKQDLVIPVREGDPLYEFCFNGDGLHRRYMFLRGHYYLFNDIVDCVMAYIPEARHWVPVPMQMYVIDMCFDLVPGKVEARLIEQAKQKDIERMMKNQIMRWMEYR